MIIAVVEIHARETDTGIAGLLVDPVHQGLIADFVGPDLLDYISEDDLRTETHDEVYQVILSSYEDVRLM